MQSAFKEGNHRRENSYKLCQNQINIHYYVVSCAKPVNYYYYVLLER